jgi:predicted MFS family arabinose efflux permease
MDNSESLGNTKLVATMSLALGVMSFDQGSVGYLLPFIKPDLGLTITEFGTIASTYWATFAIASYVIAILAAARGATKSYLIGALILFGVCACLSGFVRSTGSLLVARAAMGLCGGALLTLGQSILALGSQPNKVATNMGLVGALGGSLEGLIIAPVILVQIASIYSWRLGYFAIAIPAWLAAILVFHFVPEVSDRATVSPSAQIEIDSFLRSTVGILRNPAVLLCVPLCGLYVAYLGLGSAFLPIYLVEVRGLSPTHMSWMIVTLGLSSILFSIALPAISNRLGRKPVLLIASAASLLAPLAALFYNGSTIVLGLLFFFGWSMSGIGTFSMGIIPAETVPSEVLTRAVGLVIAIGILLGGLVGPLIAGWSADQWGMRAPLFVQATCAALSAVVALALRETAPDRVASPRGLQEAVASPARSSIE